MSERSEQIIGDNEKKLRSSRTAIDRFPKNIAHSGYLVRNFTQVRSEAKLLKLKRFIVIFTLATILNV